MGQAGRLGVVTVATNMAGRGTDILLGGNPSVMARIYVRDSLARELLSEEDLAKVPQARRRALHLCSAIGEYCALLYHAVPCCALPCSVKTRGVALEYQTIAILI